MKITSSNQQPCSPLTSCAFGAIATSLIASSWLLLFMGILTTSSAENFEDTTAWTFPIDCRPYHLRSMKVLFKNFNKCSRELKANTTSTQEYEDKLGCAMKCTMQATGYAVNGLVTAESISNAVERLLPRGLVIPVAQILTNKCHEKYGDKLEPEEEHCRGYYDYAFCIQNSIAELVDSDLCIKFEKEKQ